MSLEPRTRRGLCERKIPHLGEEGLSMGSWEGLEWEIPHLGEEGKQHGIVGETGVGGSLTWERKESSMGSWETGVGDPSPGRGRKAAWDRGRDWSGRSLTWERKESSMGLWETGVGDPSPGRGRKAAWDRGRDLYVMRRAAGNSESHDTRQESPVQPVMLDGAWNLLERFTGIYSCGL